MPCTICYYVKGDVIAGFTLKKKNVRGLDGIKAGLISVRI